MSEVIGGFQCDNVYCRKFISYFAHKKEEKKWFFVGMTKHYCSKACKDKCEMEKIRK